jgi:diacylglycerol kinase (ATP)
MGAELMSGRETGTGPAARQATIVALARSFVHAWNGLIHTVVHQRNMRVHVVSAMLVSLVGSGIPLGIAEKVTLVFCVLLVHFAEILNSALEQMVDLATEKLHERARLAKDAAAAGVLVLALGTVVIFVTLLVHNWDDIAAHGSQIRRQSLLGVPLATSAAALMAPPPRSAKIDALLLAACLGLWAALVPQSRSLVFSAMSAGLIVVAFAAARARRRSRGSGGRPPAA